MTDWQSWHEKMRGRAYAVLILVEDRLPTDTAALAHEMVDHNEYGIAIDMIRDAIAASGVELTAEEASAVDAISSELADAARHPTDPMHEDDRGRMPFWLAPEEIRWIADHCVCERPPNGSHTLECKWIRFRAKTALYKAGLWEM